MSAETQKLFLQIGPLVILILLMYFMLIRPQKKKEKEINAMRAALKVGDTIVTIGGICGKVVKIKDDTIVIQVGADKVKFEMMKWAVSQVVSSKGSKSSSKDEVLDVEVEEAKTARPKRLKKAEAPEEVETKEEVVDVVPEPVGDEDKAEK